jgi:transposase
MSNGPPITLVKQACELYEAGHHCGELEELLGHPAKTINGWIHRYGEQWGVFIRPTPTRQYGWKRISQEEIEQVVLMYENGATMREIATHFGWPHHSYVRVRLEHAGVPQRPRSRVSKDGWKRRRGVGSLT